MAYTIKYTPPAYSSLHDDLIYTVAEPIKTADPITYPNYKFIADVYIGGNLVARIKKVQDPVTGIGIFNIGQIVRNYVATQFNPATTLLVAQTFGLNSFNQSVIVKFGEEYAFTSFYNIVVDSARVFFNHYNGRLKGVTTVLAALADKVVTNKASTSQVTLTSLYSFIPYFPTSTSSVSVVIMPFGGGSAYSTNFSPANANDLQLLNISPVNLNALHAGTITAATQYYTVQIGGQTYRYDIICEPVFAPWPIHFLNQYGGFETKIFSKVSHTSYDITRKDFGKLAFSVDAAGIPSYKSNNGVYNETRSEYYVDFKETMILNTDNLTDAEYLWLRDLMVSPMVYVEDSGFFFPVVIKETDYEPKKNINEDLSNLTITLQFGNTNNAQFR